MYPSTGFRRIHSFDDVPCRPWMKRRQNWTRLRNIITTVDSDRTDKSSAGQCQDSEEDAINIYDLLSRDEARLYP